MDAILKIQTEQDIVKRHIAVSRLIAEMKALDQIECPLEHEFSDGVYMRKMFAPKGAFIVGKIHRYRTMNILLSGSAAIICVGDNLDFFKIKAPHTFTSEAGVRKILYFYEDSVFATVHPTNERDLDKIEAQFIIPDDEFADMLEQKILQGGI